MALPIYPQTQSGQVSRLRTMLANYLAWAERHTDHERELTETIAGARDLTGTGFPQSQLLQISALRTKLAQFARWARESSENAAEFDATLAAALNALPTKPAVCTTQPLSDETVGDGHELITEWDNAERYIWTRDGVTLNDGQSFAGTKTDTLTIVVANENTPGNYICSAFNAIEARTDSDVAIVNIPDAE